LTRGNAAPGIIWTRPSSEAYLNDKRQEKKSKINTRLTTLSSHATAVCSLTGGLGRPLELRKIRNMKKHGLLLVSLFFFLFILFFLFRSLFTPKISSYWQTEENEFIRWRISSSVYSNSDTLFIGGQLRNLLGTNNKFKAGIKNIKAYLKDTVVTLSFDTVDFQFIKSEKSTSIKNRGDDKIKIEVETIFQTNGYNIDSTFTLWIYRKTRKEFVYQSIYQYVLAWMFVLSPH
jgi:hypothetical protein